MAETPLLEGILEIHQLFGELVEFPMRFRVLVDLQPRSLDARMRLVADAGITRQHGRINRKAVSRQRADRLVVKRRRGQHVLQVREDLRPMPEGAEKRLALVAHQEFQFAILLRLEAGGWAELVAELQIIRRCHRREDRPAFDQDRLNARDAGEHLEARPELIRADRRHRGMQLVQHQAHPEFARLMDDDEQHLVVLVADAALEAKQFVDGEIIAIGKPALGKIGVGPLRQVRCVAHDRFAHGILLR